MPCSARASSWNTPRWPGTSSASSCDARACPPGRWLWPGSGWTSLIEIGASTVVMGTRGTGGARQRRALRLIGVGFAALAVYLLVQSTAVWRRLHPRHSPLGIGWTADHRRRDVRPRRGQGPHRRRPGQPGARDEGRVTLIDGLLAAAVLLGLALNSAVGWWSADPAAGYVLVYYAVREVREILTRGR